jgi:hypothetical protein
MDWKIESLSRTNCTRRLTFMDCATIRLVWIRQYVSAADITLSTARPNLSTFFFFISEVVPNE